MNTPEIIRQIQEKLGVTEDGMAGPETWNAIHDYILPHASSEHIHGDAVDDRSEKVVATLLPQVRPYARALVHEAAAAGITIKVISGTRTYAEQDALYDKGRTKPGPKVTNARGGYSNHNFSVAFDVGVFSGTRYLPESPAYKAVGAIGRRLGLEWGGLWRSFVDEPHFQMMNGKTLAEARALHAKGKNVFS